MDGNFKDFNDTCIRDYSKIINANPILNRKEELSLVKIIRKFNSGKQKQAAREKLIHSNLRMVVKEASHYCRHSNVPLEDLIIAGSEGLCIAIDKFNPRKYKTKLSTYAIPWIKLKIFGLLSDFNSNIHIPPHILEQSRRYLKSINDSVQDEDLMKELNVTERGLRNIRMAQSHVVSLSDTRYIDEAGEETTMEDVIPDVKFTRPDNVLVSKEIRSRIAEELLKLKPSEIEILTRRYINDTKDDLADIGKDLHITGERVRQIEVKALRLLKRRMKNRNSFDI